MTKGFDNPAPLAPTNAGAPSAPKVVNASGASSSNTKAVKKKGAQAGDASIKDAANKDPKGKTDSGARHGIRVKFQRQEEPSAGATMANAKLLPPATPRQSPNFAAGRTDHP